MSNEDSTDTDLRVEYTSEFKRNIRQLAKRYRRIKSDVDPVIKTLLKGKSGGYRKSDQRNVSVDQIRKIIAEHS